MHITLAVQGKLKDSSLKALYEEYKKRLDWKIILQEDKELPPSSFLITLDEQGESLTSEDFAALLHDIQMYHQGKVTFVIGDADGIPPVIKEKATKSLS